MAREYAVILEFRTRIGGLRPHRLRWASQLLLLDPVRVLGVRLVQKGWRDRRWGVAELWIDGPVPP